ncbi:cytochrome C oxidase subunit III [Leptospira congkakensis]|uniref:Cytochrome C oxidase subunit III n=1 Tax=Leptospira congkakensis TaxID=2484932 RepID=A0A4Z1ANU0_9LEPT|nr:cytochrome c oxidase subunit 3 [Leptospira congkakensis]TGL85560.1 cytochrome C oxidase subunit III [Leptospira congkakensis]TGL92319.1 cytochrome C oxidase subunit III [Leptospira congkakensis]TGM00065.1 cytochrome C oxidase subunit III [Leptospira congkakensis]
MSDEKNFPNQSLWYPPGGILIWMIVFVEVLTFCLGIGSLLYDKSKDPTGFLMMQSKLTKTFAFWNTIFLLSSGFCIALAVFYKTKQKLNYFTILLSASIVFGFAFLFLKFYEFREKWNLGFDLDGNIFFSYYWLLTGFHYLHVVVGVLILFIIYRSRKTISFENLEAGAVFWHMCDLIWLLLYPALYLIQ